MEELKNFNAAKLYRKCEMDDVDFVDWLQRLGLLHSKRTCDCGGNMNLEKAAAGRIYGSWKCNKRIRKGGRKCGKKKGFLSGTWFDETHLSLKDVFKLFYFWCRQTHTQDEVRFDLQRPDGTVISRTAIVQHNHWLREICTEYVNKHAQKIGGYGKVVEIDETIITKRKYERGRLVSKQQWLFTGVERGSKMTRLFIKFVDKRNADTLLPLLQELIAPGTTILSDGWAAYFDIKNLPEGFEHWTINHSENFVAPDNREVHTQSIESLHQKLKARHKEDYGTARVHLASYVDLFVWRRLFAGPDVMFNLCTQMRDMYPVESIY